MYCLWQYSFYSKGGMYFISKMSYNRFMKYMLIFIIYIYRYTISYFIGRQCRFEPSCSEYAIGCLKIYGAWQGGKLAIRRILSCRPGGKHGYDPVPKKYINNK